MGMFDTFYFQRPIYNPFTGEKYNELQTKCLKCNLDEYSVGDKVKNINNAILKEELYYYINCSLNLLDILFVYIVIEDSIYQGVFLTDNIFHSLKYNVELYEDLGSYELPFKSYETDTDMMDRKEFFNNLNEILFNQKEFLKNLENKK